MALVRRMNSTVVARIAFILLIVACVVPLGLRSLRFALGPSIEIIDTEGVVRSISLAEMKTLPVLKRAGSYQNQYGNWRDEGIYSGVLLMDLIGEASFGIVEVVADDGYRVAIEKDRLDDRDYPMVLAFRMDNAEVPHWEDGFRIAVLPEDGGVSNADYGVDSAGGFWVKQVTQLILASE